MKKEHNIKGNIKSIKQLSYVAHYDSELLTKGMRSRMDEDYLLGEGTDSDDYYSLYDKNNLIIEKQRLDWDNSVFEKIIFVRSPVGKNIETIVYDAHSKLKSKAKEYYDENDYLVKTCFFNSNDSLDMEFTFEYDLNGNRVKSSTYDAQDGDLFSQNINSYDKNNNLIESEIFSSINSNLTLINKTIYKYDEKSQIIEELSFDTSLNIEEKKLFEYDKFGSVLEICTYNSEFELIKKIKNKYDYDEKGNWIKCTVFIEKELGQLHPIYIVERGINYLD
ncbi:hypothetical protein [Thalassobellus citreus]|uniref:hypothetical protein n=1 Tax=Thalassobellus citreus TaxID=3367752 RepID=UPI0037B41B26